MELPATSNFEPWFAPELRPSCELSIGCPSGLYGALRCQGSITPFLSTFVIPFFCSARAASIPPSRPHISIAVARSGGQGRRFFSVAEGLSLTDASTAGRQPVIGVVGRATIRGEPAIGRDQSREPRLYSVEPVWGPDHEAVIRSCGQGSEAAGPFSQRHCSHSRMRIAATSDRYRLPGASSAVRCRTLFVLSRSKVFLTSQAAARHRPAPRRS